MSFGSGLKCSPGLGCHQDYYPSEMKGLELVRINYQDYLCEDTYGGKECHRWSGSGSPKQAVSGMADLYCNNSGVCDEGGYPSGY